MNKLYVAIKKRRYLVCLFQVISILKNMTSKLLTILLIE